MTPERLRQIAILVDTLDAAQSDRLLDQFPETVQQQVRMAVVNLPQIDAEERQRVIQNFVQSKRPAATTQSSAASGTYGDPRLKRPTPAKDPVRGEPVSEYQKYLNRRSESEPNATSPASSPTIQPGSATEENGLVDALSQADLETLAAVVLKESPQVLAVVLSLLPADRSARLLELLPAGHQQQALQRLSQLEDIDDQVLDYLQQQLDRIIRRRVQLKRHQNSGPQALASILAAAHQLNATQVVQSIHHQMQPTPHFAMPSTVQAPFAASEHSHSPVASVAPSVSSPVATHPMPTTASHFHSPEKSLTAPAAAASQTAAPLSPTATTATAAESAMDDESRLASPEVNQVDAFSEAAVRFPFAQLANCDRASLEALLATARPKLTLLALRGAPPKLLTRVLKLLPAQEAKEVEYRIANLGPTRLQDIQQAQNYLLRLATVLEDMGRFRRPRKSLLPF